MPKIMKSYNITADGVKAQVQIVEGDDYAKMYKITIPRPSPGTMALLESIKEDLIREAKIGTQEIFDASVVQRLKDEFSKKANILIEKRMPGLPDKTKKMLIGSLIHEMLGLGKIEMLLGDSDLEEIVMNTALEPIWVYHIEFGWLKTNIIPESERQIQNYASIVARRIGRQITTLTPLLDAHLITGDRANATLFPISTKGNTLTIRKFARKPWTVTDFIANDTLNLEVASFMWMMIQYELNMIIAGGTSSGKTALLNTLMPFIQPNHRIVSIEDTRELQLPDFLHWVPLTTREPNPEGKGEVSMLDLMINSLRMRPDRIVVGEIRRGDQAEVLFEAMHTGHSVYSTLHADTADQVIRRMTNPPINVPEVMLEAVHGVVVVYRDRRTGIRKIYQVAELMPSGESEDEVTLRPNVLYRCKPNGQIVPHAECIRIFDALKIHTNMTQKDLISELGDKMAVLDWMVKRNINHVNDVGRVVAEYYCEPDKVISMAKSNRKPDMLK